MSVIHGDCVEVMAGMDPESVDAIVCDPPYGLEFMGKEWDGADGFRRSLNGADAGRDSVFGRTSTRAPEYRAGSLYQAWSQQWAEAAYRVAKPSAYLLAFGGTRTVHRMTVALEDAGWIIRDMLVWAYASGFPKSKASLKPAWEPIVMARKPGPLRMLAIDECRIPMGDEADAYRKGQAAWANSESTEGYGAFVASNPATRFETTASLGRWPANVILSEEIFEPGVPGVVIGGSLTGTMTAWSSSPDNEPSPIASPVRRADRQSSRSVPGVSFPASATAPVGTQLDAWGTSTDTPKPDTGCSDGTRAGAESTSGSTAVSGSRPTVRSPLASSSTTATVTASTTTSPTSNSSPEPSTTGTTRPRPLASSEDDGTREPETSEPSSDASASWSPSYEPAEAGYSRFFLIPKSSRSDREPVLGGLPVKEQAAAWGDLGPVEGNPRKPDTGHVSRRQNVHPTVKPTDLMRHLVRLVTPPGGTVLDPFLGSGTTALAAEMEGFAWIGIEREAEYVAIAEARLNGTQRGLGLDVPAPTKKPPNTHPDLAKHQPKVRNPSGGTTLGKFSKRWTAEGEDPAA